MMHALAALTIDQSLTYCSYLGIAIALARVPACNLHEHVIRQL